MNATTQPALEQQQDSPAEAVLERFLADTLQESAPGPDKSDERLAEVDLRTDILYVLTDKTAYRKALPLSGLIQEVQALQVSELSGAPLTDERIKASLKGLFQQRLVREFTARENHYELAHDFLVRYVVRTYRELERRRISQLAVLKQQQKATHEEYARLSRMGSTVSALLQLLPILTFGLTIGLFLYAANRTLPDLLGFAYLWVLALPGATLLLLGVAVRRAAPISLATLILLCCAGTWLYEYSQPEIDLARAYDIHVLIQSPYCYQFAISAASSLGSNSYTDWFSSRCNTISSSMDDLNTRHMVWNAAGLEKDHELLPNANFCYDVSKVFGQANSQRERALLRACWQHTPDWSFYLAYADNYTWQHIGYTGVSIPRYQTGYLHWQVGLFAFFLLLGHVLFYPAVLLGTIQNVTVSSALRRISSEISEVIFIFITFVGSQTLFYYPYYHYPYYPSPYFWYLLRPTRITFLLVHAIVYLIVSTILSALKHSNIGTLFLKLSIADRAGSPAISVGKLIGRSFLLWTWGICNLFFGVPTLIITPLYVWLRKDHQLIYDSLLKLRTEPKKSTEESATRETAIGRTPNHTATAAT